LAEHGLPINCQFSRERIPQVPQPSKEVLVMENIQITTARMREAAFPENPQNRSFDFKALTVSKNYRCGVSIRTV